jgi:hypothetical protein
MYYTKPISVVDLDTHERKTVVMVICFTDKEDAENLKLDDNIEAVTTLDVCPACYCKQVNEA